MALGVSVLAKNGKEMDRSISAVGTRRYLAASDEYESRYSWETARSSRQWWEEMFYGTWALVTGRGVSSRCYSNEH